MVANNKTKVFKSLDDLQVDPYYKGKLSTRQLYGNTYKGEKFTNETVVLSPYQHKLFKRALYGLSAYHPEEVSTMNKWKKERIINVNKRAVTILNLYKQEIINYVTNTFFIKLFPNSKLTNVLVSEEFSTAQPNLKVKLSNDDIGINKEQIIDLFIKKKVLPSNFRFLKDEVKEVF